MRVENERVEGPAPNLLPKAKHVSPLKFVQWYGCVYVLAMCVSAQKAIAKLVYRNKTEMHSDGNANKS